MFLLLFVCLFVCLFVYVFVCLFCFVLFFKNRIRIDSARVRGSNKDKRDLADS